MSDFFSLRISERMVNELNNLGIVTPTPIQEKVIPLAIDGKDVIAQAQTGTGKTFAFVLPILEKINFDVPYVQTLIVTPTRELALQISDELNKLIENIDGIDVLAVYGGQDVERQLKKLQNNIQIVVGTPGRLLDHLRRETIDLSRISCLVLDEADQMLHIGFLGEVEEIIEQTPESRQTMLFSATIPPEIRTLAKEYMNDPKYVQVEKKQGPAVTVKQIAIHTVDRAKQATLMKLMDTYRPYLAVVFCRTKRRVSKLYSVLKVHGYNCDELHGDLTQGKREQVMKRFREGDVQYLVATDVAARGLDIEGVTHVFNYDIPQDAESYIHRIGRTGRAGMKGLAITLYSSADRPTLDLIEKELQITIQKQNIGNNTNRQNKDKESDSLLKKSEKGSQRSHREKEKQSRSEDRDNQKKKHTKNGKKGKTEQAIDTRRNRQGAKKENISPYGQRAESSKTHKNRKLKSNRNKRGV